MLSILSAITFDISKIDENAITIFIIGFGIVFAALISIYLFFNFLPKLLTLNFKKKKKTTVAKTSGKSEKSESIVDDEVYAAIAMALHLHLEDQHDEESMVLTLDLARNINTQWNSKIQNINNK